MSFVDTKIKLLLKRLPKPLPDNYNLVADVRSGETCSKLLDSLQMRIAISTVEQAVVKFGSGESAIVNPSVTWGEMGLKDGLEYVLEVRGQAMDLEVNAGEDFKPVEYMTEKEYDEKKGTLRDFLKTNKLGKFSEDYKEKKQKETEEQLALYQDMKDKVGSRVELENGVRGELKFVGETDFATGFWAGIGLDEPYGKNNGSVNGKQYFTCVDSYGLFLRLNKFKIGDFPPLDDGLLDDDEII
ncbi:tubulin-folding cofactor B-like [Convolutriloba macropyga]|uniref:tubulin-folding cofactor B-like n=1 Tax=Convolutriloba macropyga TaxID=536237 RepID=UPI003F51E1E4